MANAGGVPGRLVNRYFVDFAAPSIQALLLSNREKYALLNDVLRAVVPGRRVLDIGAGTGVLSLLAHAHGASAVVAVERPSVAWITKAVLDSFAALPHPITLMTQDFFDLRSASEKFDVVISETIGYVGFEENIAPIMARARDYFASSQTVFVPETLRLIAVPLLGTPGAVQVDGTVSLGNGEMRKADFVVLREPAAYCLGQRPGNPLHFEWTLSVFERSLIHGAAFFFEAGLPGKRVLDNLPGSAWPYCRVSLARPLSVEAGQQLSVSLDLLAGDAEYSVEVGIASGDRPAEYVSFKASDVQHPHTWDAPVDVGSLIGQLRGLFESLGLAGLLAAERRDES